MQNDKMSNATLTYAGACRIGHPKLAGKIVQYDKIHELGTCVKNVYYKNKRLGGCLSFSGDDPGLILDLNKETQ